MHIRVIMNKEKGKNNIKKENRSTQKEIPLTPQQTDEIPAKPPDNFQMNESVKVSNSTVQQHGSVKERLTKDLPQQIELIRCSLTGTRDKTAYIFMG